MSWKSWSNTDDGETEECLTSTESLDALLFGSTASEHSSDSWEAMEEDEEPREEISSSDGDEEKPMDNDDGMEEKDSRIPSDEDEHNFADDEADADKASDVDTDEDAPASPASHNFG
jgi:hypothetical protein